MYNLDEYHSSRSYCAEQFQQEIYSVCLMTPMQLHEILVFTVVKRHIVVIG